MLAPAPTGKTVVPSDIQRMHFKVFQELEVLMATWFTIAVAVLVFGVLVHINLNYIIGVCIMFDGIIMIFLTLISSGLSIRMLQNFEWENFIQQRLYVLYAKYALLVLLIGFSTWAGVVMIMRSL